MALNSAITAGVSGLIGFSNDFIASKRALEGGGTFNGLYTGALNIATFGCVMGLIHIQGANYSAALTLILTPHIRGALSCPISQPPLMRPCPDIPAPVPLLEALKGVIGT